MSEGHDNRPLAWPRIGLGCASLGQPSIADVGAERVIAAAIDRGIRFFDVAPLYGGGLGECRLGRALQASGLAREDYLLCTKTGVTRAFGQGAIPPGGLRRREADVWDYSEHATRESVARSCARLRVDRLDVVHLHDVEDHVEACLEGWSALDSLRHEGIVGGIGVGVNSVAPLMALLERKPFDALLLAGRYTLLDQSGTAVFERAQRDGVRVVVGGVFNSGILGSWPPSSATFNYSPASESLVERTAKIAALCERHRVPIGAAALQFVLRHPAVTTMLIGPTTVDELQQNLSAIEHPIPDALWDDLQAAGFIPRVAEAAQAAELIDAH